jgi:hypothetical protein
MASLSLGVVTSLTVARQAIFVNHRVGKGLELKSMPFGSDLTWTLIEPNAGGTITGDFMKANITLPNNVSETPGALPKLWQCDS